MVINGDKSGERPHLMSIKGAGIRTLSLTLTMYSAPAFAITKTKDEGGRMNRPTRFVETPANDWPAISSDVVPTAFGPKNKEEG